MTKIWNDDHTKCQQGCGDTRNSHSLMVGRQNDAATLEDSLVIPYKIKHTLSMGPSNHDSCYLLEETENVCPHKSLHMDLCSSFIHHCQNLEATKISCSRLMDKSTVVYSNNGILLSALKKKKKRAVKP